VPSWRPLSWVILVINVLFLVTVIGVMVASGTSSDCGTLSPETCADPVRKAIASWLIFLPLWITADVILGIVWLARRPGRTPTPDRKDG
jgi:hypothetical protein